MEHDNAIQFIDFDSINSPSNDIREEHGYFVRDNKHLFFASYCPVASSETGIVMVSPFGEEKVRTLRIYVSLSRALARLGITVINFDFFGDGDSEGNFEDALFEDRIKDVESAVGYLKEKYSIKKVGLLGLRWGGTIAALASRGISPEFLILWEPVIDSKKYFMDHLRSNIASQMIAMGKITKNREALVKELEAGSSVPVEGYQISGKFFTAAREGSLSAGNLKYEGKTLIVQISANQSVTRPELLSLKNSLPGAELAIAPKEFEWEKTDTWNPAPRELFGHTFKFLAQNNFIDQNRISR
jgi:alpha/beta superfamily hydrolase